MVQSRPGMVRRALVATLALYAFVLAGFVSGLRPVVAAPAEWGVLCTHDGRQDAPASPAGTDHASCCVLACAAALSAVAALPSPPATEHPARAAAPLRWVVRSSAPDDGAARCPFHARGPPAA